MSAVDVSRPFYCGEVGHWDALICDYLMPSGNACDEVAEYAIQWKQRPYDCGTVPFSGACKRHGADVPRAEVEVIRTQRNAS